MKILVTGANGQVGSELQAIQNQYIRWSFHFHDVDTLDITNAEMVRDFFEKNQINACINCAAYTAVDKAESDQDTAYAVNVTGAENLAKACADRGGAMIHYSTDYVYHGTQNRPFRETDATSPGGVYAATKLEGDERVLAANSRAVALRTSWVYSSFGHNFVKTMLRLGKERDQLTVIFDQVGTPTYARDIAVATLDILQKLERGNAEELSGIYHFSNEGVTSWYDFAKAIFEIENINCRVLPIETKDYPTPAARPHFSVLNKAKIKAAFDIEIPHWRDSLKDCLVAIRGFKSNNF